MTKVLATATAAMLLADRGKLSLTAPVARYLPHFAANGKGGVLVRDLLRYSSGLPIDNQKVDTDDIDAIWRFMEETPLEYPTGSMVEYSDLGYRLLGRVIEAVAGTSLDAFAKREIWGPLGMADTTYNPAASLVPRCAATGPGSLLLRPGPLRGSVQDDQDWKVGGIVGCDGAFATARDVAVFSQMILNGGSYGDVRLLPRKLVAAMVANQTPQVTEAATDAGSDHEPAVHAQGLRLRALDAPLLARRHAALAGVVRQVRRRRHVHVDRPEARADRHPADEPRPARAVRPARLEPADRRRRRRGVLRRRRQRRARVAPAPRGPPGAGCEAAVTAQLCLPFLLGVSPCRGRRR